MASLAYRVTPAQGTILYLCLVFNLHMCDMFVCVPRVCGYLSLQYMMHELPMLCEKL